MLRRTACCSKWQLAIRPCISTDDLGLAYDEIATWVLALVIRKGVHGLVQEDSLSEEGDMLLKVRLVPSFSESVSCVDDACNCKKDVAFALRHELISAALSAPLLCDNSCQYGLQLTTTG